MTDDNSHTKMFRKKLGALAHENCQEQGCTQQLCSGQRVSTSENHALQDSLCSPLPTRARGLVSTTVTGLFWPNVIHADRAFIYTIFKVYAIINGILKSHFITSYCPLSKLIVF